MRSTRIGQLGGRIACVCLHAHTPRGSFSLPPSLSAHACWVCVQHTQCLHVAGLIVARGSLAHHPVWHARPIC